MARYLVTLKKVNLNIKNRMKTAPKVLLLVFGIVQLVVVLLLSLPTIPSKIKAETLGTQYTFEDISFNLTRTDMEFPDQETLIKLKQGKSGDFFLLMSDNNDKLIIVKSEENTTIVKELLNNVRNPFKHRSFEVETRTLFWLFSGKKKTIVQSIVISDVFICNLDINLEDQYYSAIFTGDNWTDADIDEFMRTVSLNN